MTLLEALIQLRDHMPEVVKPNAVLWCNPSYGICDNLLFLDISSSDFKKFNRLCIDWPQFSGDSIYPVGGKCEFLYDLARDTLWVGDSRRLRMSLINFAIEELSK